MESFIPYIVSLLVLLVSLSLIFLKKTTTSTSTTKNLPPGRTGWPLLGENIEFILSGPQKFVSDRATKYSPVVFKSSLWGEKIVAFCGSTGNKFLFLNEDKVVTSWWPVSMRKALVYPNFSDKSVREIIGVNRVVIHDFLKPEALKSYIPTMDSMVREHVEKEWKGDIKVFPLSKHYTFALACRVFMSVKDSDIMKRFGEPFSAATSGLFSVPIDLPGTAYNRALKGGKKVREELLKIIRNKKKELLENKEGADKDLLAHLLIGTSGFDPIVSEMEISNSIMGLLVASYDTTSTAITFIFKYLAELPHVYNEVYKEQMAIAKSKGPGELLNWDDLHKMKYSWNVACEALRLVPPVLGAFKEATTDFTYGGFTIPKGWKTFWSVYSTHTNPKYFPNPEEFDPTRFDGDGPKPYSFVPFGGGSRMCAGKEYARLEILVFIHSVVTKFKLEKLSPNEKVKFHASPTATEGVPIRLHPHGKEKI